MNLPINAYRNEIIDAVDMNDVTIISAETGSGKSTQIAQILLEKYERIIVTEPRIMAAKTLAKRVAEEMNVTLGEEVGYRTGYDKCCSHDTKIQFCTDGLQMIRSIFSDDTASKDVLIIDEIHEWNLNIETLVAWCKFMLKKWNTKVVLMSATMETDELAKFFETDVAVLKIPGSCYDVEMEERSAYDLCDSVKEAVELHKNVLVFVPGKKEISNVIRDLTELEVDAVMLPLHGELDWDEQKRCFYTYDKPKVIVATNVAQTSITIPDIDVVVDTGLARITIAEEGIQGLFLKNISKADILQRKGRAGRTKEGKYILCSSTGFYYREEYSCPEIQRSLLGRVVLQLTAIGLDAETLKFFHQPKIEAIKLAKKNLIAIGALNDENKITELGEKIVKIPVSVHLARMIVEAEKYHVVKPVITIASIMEMGGLLAKDGDYSDFTEECNSDLLAEFDVWNFICKSDNFDFKKYGINKKNFFRIKDHIKKLNDVLYGIVSLEPTCNVVNREAILKSCLSGMSTNIYVNTFYHSFEGSDSVERKRNKKSCTIFSDIASRFLVGIPMTIEFTNKYGGKSQMDLLDFCTVLTDEMLLEIAPNEITSDTSLNYSKDYDAVEVVEKKLFRGYLVSKKSHIEYSHPEYEAIKAKYEEELEEFKKSHFDWQESVQVGDKSFDVHYMNWPQKAYIYIDEETLFSTDENNIYLENGMRVWVRYEWDECSTISALRNTIQRKKIAEIRRETMYKIQSISVTSLKDVLKNREWLGEIDLSKGYCEPQFVYCCLIKDKNTVYFELENDSDMAEANTKEALQFLFIKEVEKNYGTNKFSHKPGKKKKVLTPEEEAVKQDFDSLVREILQELTPDNIEESLAFLEEYYKEVMT